MWQTVLDRAERLLIRYHKRRRRVVLSDTTLRDGEQMPGVRFDPDAKLRIAQALARAGIDGIDAGFPAAAPEEVAAIRRIAREVRGPVITALCRTVRADVDGAVEALQDGAAYKTGVTLFLGTSPEHRTHKHRLSPAETVRTAVEAVAYARRFFRIVTFGPEDAARTEPDFLCEVYREVIAAGATTVGFTDTIGILTPRKAADHIKQIQDGVPNLGDSFLAVHFHNDLGLATANALACIAQGADVVQGTVNGIGERAGNTALEEVVMALHLHADEFGRRCGVDPRQLYELSTLVARLTGRALPPNKAIVGANMFLTESGIHQAGLLRDPSTYLPFPPEVIGAGPVRLALGKHSGRHAVRHCLAARGNELSDHEVERVLDYLKDHPRRPLYVSEADFEELLGDVFGSESQRPAAAPEAAAAAPTDRPGAGEFPCNPDPPS